MIKLLITTSSFNKELLNYYFIKKKFKITCNTSGKKANRSFLLKNITNVSAIIAGTENYDESILKLAKNLKLICRIGVGLDNIDLTYCKKKNIKVITSKTDLSIGVAEHTLSLVMSALKNINDFDSSIKKNIWKKKYTNLLYGKKFGIIGLGKIGKQVYKFLKPYKLEFFYNDKIKIRNQNIDFKTINQILNICDIVSIHLPYNENTKHLINKKNLPKNNSNLILVNTSRGNVINEKDLYGFLSKNKNAMACLDVFENEPYKGELKKLSNTILTPHVSGYSFELRNLMEKEAIETLIRKLSDK